MHNKNGKTVSLVKTPAMLLVYRLAATLLLFSLSRWMIYLFNFNIFHKLTSGEAFRLYIAGLRFDICTLAYINIPLILAYTLPFPFRDKKWFQNTIEVIFIVLNGAAIVLNLIDVVYFRYIGKRMTSELFQFLGNDKENINGLLGQFANDFWFIIVTAVVFIMVLVVVARETKMSHNESHTNTLAGVISGLVPLLLFAFLTVIACRGGFQNKPINLATSLKYTNSDNVPIVLNTPFSIAKSKQSQRLEMMNIVDNPTYTPIHYGTRSDRFIKDGAYKNAVIIILESFGQEVTGYYNKKRDLSITPFLDSLLSKSVTFEGYANGRRSIEALPSILDGLPSLMESDFSSSMYFGNHIEGIGTHLKKHGFRTAFFHGGNNGTMNFDAIAKQAGFDEYYGRDEYNNDNDFDRKWGIFDGPFMQYAAEKINEFDTCFAAVIFSLSSHHPFTLPEGFKLPDRSNQWTNFEKTVYYTDQSLRDFFNKAKQYPWFDSTLFVITSDHANTEHLYPEYSTIIGMYAVPIAFYSSDIKACKTGEIAQQTDIGISTLAALGINDTIFSFGRNVFDKTEKQSFISYINQTYQYSDGDYLLQSDGAKTLAIYRFRNDRMLKNDLSSHINCNDVAQDFKERLQEYNNRMITNELYYKKDIRDEYKTDTIVHN